DIAALEEEIKKIEENLQTSKTYQNFMAELEAEIEPLKKRAEQHQQDLIDYEKERKAELEALSQLTSPDILTKIKSAKKAQREISARLNNEVNQKIYKEYNEKMAKLEPYKKLKKGDLLPLSLGISVSMQYAQLAKLRSRADRLKSGEEVAVN